MQTYGGPCGQRIWGSVNSGRMSCCAKMFIPPHRSSQAPSGLPITPQLLPAIWADSLQRAEVERSQASTGQLVTSSPSLGIATSISWWHDGMRTPVSMPHVASWRSKVALCLKVRFDPQRRHRLSTCPSQVARNPVSPCASRAPFGPRTSPESARPDSARCRWGWPAL